MKTLSRDTSPEAERVQIEILRKKTPKERFQMAMALIRSAVTLSRRAIRNAHPEYSEQDVSVEFVRLNYGKELADGYRKDLESRRS